MNRFFNPIKSCRAAALFFLLLLTSHWCLAQERLISTSAGVSELIVALGLGDELVAVDVTTQLPAPYDTLPDIGYHRTLSAEGLLSLKPSMIIGGEHMGPVKTIEALKKAEVTVVQLPTAYDSQQLQQNISLLTSALQRPQTGAELIKDLQQSLSQLRSSSLQGKRVGFLLNMDSKTLRLAGTGTSGDALIRLLGADNVATYKNYRNVSAESLFTLRPQVLLVAGRSVDGAAQELLASHPALKTLHEKHQVQMLGVDSSGLVDGLSMRAVAEAVRLSQVLSEDRLRSEQHAAGQAVAEKPAKPF